MKRMLFVDDESNMLGGIRRMLYADRTRWEMQFVLSGEAALKECGKKSGVRRGTAFEISARPSRPSR